MTHDGSTVRVVLLQTPLRRVLGAGTPEYVLRNTGCLPAMGLLYLQAAVERSRHESIFVDANLAGWDHDEAAHRAASHEPDLIGIQATTFNMPDAYLTARAIKRIRPDIAVMIGGPHPTIFPRETAALDAVDFAFAGEGEVDFIRFLDAYGDPKARAGAPGVACKTDGGVSCTPSGGLLADLDGVPRPARKSSPYKDYTSVLAARNPVTVMITSRGCPFDCIFCNRMGRKYRYHSAEYVLAEIDEITELGIGEVFIHDDTFSVNKQRVEAICRGLIERRTDLLWEARTRVDCVDEALLGLMRRAGCRRLSFGVESGSPRVLEALRKGVDLGHVKDVFCWCRREGITTLGDFLIGALDERREDMKKTFDLVGAIRPDYVQYSILSPFPGTPLYRMGLDTGLIERDIWREFAQDPLREFRTPVWTQYFSEEELVKLTAGAYRRFYMRPSYMLKQAAKIRSFRQFRNMAAAAMGMLRH